MKNERNDLELTEDVVLSAGDPIFNLAHELQCVLRDAMRGDDALSAWGCMQALAGAIGMLMAGVRDDNEGKHHSVRAYHELMDILAKTTRATFDMNVSGGNA